MEVFKKCIIYYRYVEDTDLLKNSLSKLEKSLGKLQKSEHFSAFLPWVAFALSAIVFICILATLHILGYNNATILRSDLDNQYIGFIQQYIRVLKGEGSFWYSFSTYLGSGSILTFAYYSLSPFNLLYLIEAVSIPTMTAIIITLKFALSAFTFQIFVQKCLKNTNAYTLIFSLSYALCGYAVSMHYHIMWLEAIYLLPIIILLILRLVDTGKFLPLIPAFAYLFITNFYMAFIVGVFSGIIFISYSLFRFNTQDKSSLRRLFKNFGLFAGTAVLAAGLCAAVLVPAAMFLFQYMAEDNFEFKTLYASLLDIINAMFIGEMQTLDTQVPLLYCGLPTLCLLPFYFFNSKIDKKEKIYAASILVFLLVAMLFLPLYKLMHAFDYPNYYGYRFAFLMVFIMLVLACRQITFLEELSLKSLGCYILGLIVFYSAMFQLQHIYWKSLKTNTQEELLINVLFFFLWFMLVLLLKRKSNFKYIVTLLSLILISFELITNGYLCINKAEHLAVDESTYNQWYYSSKEAIEQIKENDSDFYRIQLNNNGNYNAAAVFGFPGFTTFSSSDNYNLRTALYHLGMLTSNRIIADTGMTDIMDMLFSAKYSVNLIRAEAGTGITPSNYHAATIEENQYALPLGYMVTPQIADYEATADPIYNQELLIYSMTGNVHVPYEPLTLDDLQIEYDNMGIAYNESSIEFYPLSQGYGGGHISFGVPTQENKQFLICFARSNPKAINQSTNIIAYARGISDRPTLSYGIIHRGATTDSMYDIPYDLVILEFSENTTLEDYCENIFAYYYDETLLPLIYNDLSRDTLSVQYHSEDTIEGTVTVSEDRPVLFTSIPYDKGWQAYVDGEPAQTYPVVDDAFLSLVLTPGEHTIRLQYVAPGSDLGAMISSCSVIVYLCVLLICLRRSKSQKISKDTSSEISSENNAIKE